MLGYQGSGAFAAHNRRIDSRGFGDDSGINNYLVDKGLRIFFRPPQGSWFNWIAIIGGLKDF